MIPATVSGSGSATLYAGEPLVIELTITDASGTAIDLTGRTFAMTAFRTSDRSTVESVVVEATGTTPTLAFDGVQTEEFYALNLAGRRLGIEIVELLDDGVDVKLEGALTVLKRASVSGSQPPVITGGAPVIQVLFRETVRSVVISQRGVPGLSAFEQLYLAGTITAPTADAFATWIQTLIAEQGGGSPGTPIPSLDFSDPKNSQFL